MKTSQPLSCVLCLAASLAVANSPAIADELVLQKVPALNVAQTPAYPLNLARYEYGAQVEAASKSQKIAQLQLSVNDSDTNTAEAALLCNDPTVGYALPAGSTTLVVALPKIENLASVSFLNRGAKGDVNVAVANAKLPATSPQWQTLTQQEISNEAIDAKIGPAEAKYVRLTFNMREAGRVAGLGIYAQPRVSDFTAPRARQLSTQDKSDSFQLIASTVNDLHAKARALYVSSGGELADANNMIDDRPTTTYAFASGDGSPTTVIDLGANATVRRVSTVYAPRAGSIEFYVLQTLPGATAAAPEMLKLDDAALANLKPVATAKDDGSRGRVAVDFPAVSGRYLMVRWAASQPDASAFYVAEIAAFGKAGADKTLLAANSNLTLAQVNEGQNDGKTMMDGKTVIEPKNGPEDAIQSPAEGPPPSLPQPPPFTFVPVMVPNSP